jgi:D-alanyl-D-alanine carboxypeptidase (penicillin-binding protein 5/6)
MGSLRVRLDGQAILSEVPLVALEGVKEAGLIGRAWDSLRLWIK